MAKKKTCLLYLYYTPSCLSVKSMKTKAQLLKRWWGWLVCTRSNMFAKIMSVLHAFMRELHEIVNFDAVLSSDLFFVEQPNVWIVLQLAHHLYFHDANPICSVQELPRKLFWCSDESPMTSECFWKIIRLCKESRSKMILIRATSKNKSPQAVISFRYNRIIHHHLPFQMVSVSISPHTLVRGIIKKEHVDKMGKQRNWGSKHQCMRHT